MTQVIDNMGDRLIAAGARAAESERKLRRLIAECDAVLDDMIGSPQSAWERMRAAVGEARKP